VRRELQLQLLDLILRSASPTDGKRVRAVRGEEGRDLVEQGLVELCELVHTREEEETQHDRHEGAPEDSEVRAPRGR
jgi:DNA-binding MarR family transcriptional regulator